jgi:hypothetical protein
LTFQAGWPSSPVEQGTAGSIGWKTANSLLINHGDAGSFDRIEVAVPVGRAFAVEAQMQGDPDTGAFGIWRQRHMGTYRLGYSAGKLFFASDRTQDGFANADVVLARSLASVDFFPGNDWHTYRFEAARTHFRALVDGVLMLEMDDSRFPGEVGNGVWTDAAAAQVRDYRLIEL